MADAVVSTPQSGLLAGLNVAVGEEVFRGQVMAKLQSPGFLELQREFLDALNANLLAQNEFDRDAQLFDEGIISQRRLQETTTRSKIAATSFNEHRQLLQIAGLSDDEIQLLETQQKLLQVIEIRAPFDGVVIERMATAGQRLDAMSPVYRLGDLSTLWLEINVPQEKLAAVRSGMKVAVTGSAVAFPAVVTTIGRSIDPATQAIMVRAVLGESDHGLKPGQFVSARIVADRLDTPGEPVWRLPAAAVTRVDESHYIFAKTSLGFDVMEVFVVSADSVNVYLSADFDADMKIAISSVSILKALWSAQREPTS
jgi:cobalt-zinc-cadmium efflux system membrane fusion protein